jgi:uncharacterized cupin superfamily protein
MTAHLWRLGAAAPLLAFGLTLAGHTAELNSKAVIYQLPEQFKWRDPTGAAAVNNVILHGDPSKPGFYVVLNRWKAGNNFSRPHFHPNDRFITVIKGTWWMGSGTKFDPENSVPLPAGTFVTHFGKQVHWDGAKAEDAFLIIVGDGPGTNTQVEPTAGPFTGIDPTAVTYTLPDQYKWRDPTGAAGVNQVVMHGDPSKTGIYVTLNRFKPGNFSRPHFHPNDRFITVVKGTWWVGTGTKFDPNDTVAMPTGTYVTHFAKEVHWDGAKDEEAWVLVVGEGPATSTRVEETK